MLTASVAISISCALSVIASAIALLALRAADPVQLRRLVSAMRTSHDELQSKLADIEQVQLPRIEAHAEAILERADLRFEGAEAKRKSVAARERHMGGGPAGHNGGVDPGDINAPRAARKEALEAMLKGGGG